jgi:hypothetical protein
MRRLIFLKANHQLESRMHEICLSGSEGGAKPTFVPTPISARRFNAGNLPITTTRPAGAPEERRYRTILVTTADLTPFQSELFSSGVPGVETPG